MENGWSEWAIVAALAIGIAGLCYMVWLATRDIKVEHVHPPPGPWTWQEPAKTLDAKYWRIHHGLAVPVGWSDKHIAQAAARILRDRETRVDKEAKNG